MKCPYTAWQILLGDHTCLCGDGTKESEQISQSEWFIPVISAASHFAYLYYTIQYF